MVLTCTVCGGCLLGEYVVDTYLESMWHLLGEYVVLSWRVCGAYLESR